MTDASLVMTLASRSQGKACFQVQCGEVTTEGDTHHGENWLPW
jgi:hypothetical protein